MILRESTPGHFKASLYPVALFNYRYLEVPGEPNFTWQVIQTGPGGGPDGHCGTMRLVACTKECYTAGQIYSQAPTEIHETAYIDSTITLNDRCRLPDGEHARVFWPIGGQWVDAMPRPATIEEVQTVTENAMRRFQ